MAYLRLSTWDGAVKGCHERHHDVVDEVLPQAAVREVHALSEASVVHLLLANGDCDLMEVLVQEEVERNLHEAERAQVLADLEDPGNAVDVLRILRHPHVQSRRDNEDGHLNRQEVRFEEAVEEEQKALVVGLLQNIVRDVREKAGINWPLRVLVASEGIQLGIGNVGVGGVTPVKC